MMMLLRRSIKLYSGGRVACFKLLPKHDSQCHVRTRFGSRVMARSPIAQEASADCRNFSELPCRLPLTAWKHNASMSLGSVVSLVSSNSEKVIPRKAISKTCRSQPCRMKPARTNSNGPKIVVHLLGVGMLGILLISRSNKASVHLSTATSRSQQCLCSQGNPWWEQTWTRFWLAMSPLNISRKNWAFFSKEADDSPVSDSVCRPRQFGTMMKNTWKILQENSIWIWDTAGYHIFRDDPKNLHLGRFISDTWAVATLPLFYSLATTSGGLDWKIPLSCKMSTNPMTVGFKPVPVTCRRSTDSSVMATLPWLHELPCWNCGVTVIKIVDSTWWQLPAYDPNPLVN